MKKWIAVAVVLMLVAAGSVMAAETEIQIAPATIVLDASCTWVTVHTDLAYTSVDAATVELDGIEMAWCKADARGNFVAKFAFGDVAEYLAPNAGGPVTLTLTGLAGGEEFAGSATVWVK